ncbi:DUF1997 domain-containing protein [Aphanothece sacrum]|uniref:Uncharacterized protein n=1 Tax=Aphanothece sacrum FPU1 TaxID=1920663 RepID=A0A401IE78_APHSA|nr:DUF1997 domain-containing protein [Aphanothece sacrum]GBF79519.1 hypothetical protein AsFPU1_0915 [Aphanothece sacrum FPU1]GBF83940.1 hypothetical protein AsFPU3_0984 [Aphanothece sacrum FPU3]
MQCQWINNHPTDLSKINHTINPQLSQTNEENPVHFQTKFAGYMEMYSDVQSVGHYLNAHQGWFCHCAAPMKTKSLDNNGYVLTIGQFASFGYEVEPKLAVVLEQPKDGVYKMYSIPLPDEPSLGYEVDYQAVMRLTEIPTNLAGDGLVKAYRKQGLSQVPDVITRVEWQLEMDVAVQFPKFIYKLPLSLIQTTGDRLLSQIVRQISPGLTYKVQQDFHDKQSLPLPPKSSRHLERLGELQEKSA